MVTKTIAPEILPSRLREFFAQTPRIAVAYSGGLDSRFLCHAASISGCDVLALHASGPHMAAEESAEALEWTALHKIPVLRFAVNPLPLPDVAANTRQRCYACKKHMFLNLIQTLKINGEGGRTICDGGNSGDLAKYRPGQAAAAGLGVFSPLALSGMDKTAISACAAKTGMDNPSQKARPCLLTRFAYGLAPDRNILRKIALAENALQKYFASCGQQAELRLRLTPAAVFLQINAACPVDEGAMHNILAEYGFGNCKILYDSDISGFFDRTA